MTLEETARVLVFDAPLYAPRELEARTAQVPDSPGVYAWFFDAMDADWNRGCVIRDGRKLLYAGVATGSGRRQSLRGRIIGDHLRGNAEGSTLRRSLGLILGMTLLTVGSRRTFGAEERRLTEWIAQHGRVCWLETADPHALELYLLEKLTLPLNIKHNPRNQISQGTVRNAPASEMLSERHVSPGR